MSLSSFFLALLVAGVLSFLLQESSQRKFSNTLPLFLFAAACMLWVFNPPLRPAGSFPAELSAAEAMARALVCVALGAASFALSSEAAGRALAGLGCGILFSVFGALAYRWIGMREAFRRLDWVFISGAAALIPFWYALTMSLVALAIFHPLLEGRRRSLVALTLLFWVSLTTLAEYELRTKRGYGSANLISAAGLISASPETVARVDLSEHSNMRFRAETLSVDSVDAAPENIRRLRFYLQNSQGHGIFSREAADLLRRILLLSWEPEAALDALSFSAGLVIPDYRQALALLRAGPLTEERRQHVTFLADSALNDPRGFESVGQSQFIFEALSTAFARFSDSEQARFWLNKVWRLWPIFEKKVEINPVETGIAGSITGIVFNEGDPAQGLSVGLFYVSAATMTYRDGANLCCVTTAANSGRFTFSGLGAGRYQLSLRGPESLIGSRVLDGPGAIELSEDTPSRMLPPIRVAR